MFIRLIYNRILYILLLMNLDWKNEGYFIRKLTFLILILLILSMVAGAAPQKFNFTMQNNTALSFENGSYIIEVIEISKPMYVKVNLTSGGSSSLKNLYDSESPINFNEIKLSASSITWTDVEIMVEFPIGWSYKRYNIVRPVVPVGVPNIVLTKSVDKTNINVGDVVKFKIKVENNGNATGYNVTLIEPLPSGFSNAPYSTFPPVVRSEIAAGESQELNYGLKAVDSGTFSSEPTIVKYGSKTSKSNSVTIIVNEIAHEKSNLSTVINIDKNNVYTGDLIKATVKITNTGNAATKFVDMDFTPLQGMEVIENNLDKVQDNIAPGETLSYRLTLKANEAGNYTIHMRTTYNDATAGMPSDSETITVTEKERNYLYILVPIIIIIVGIVLFTIKRHKEYSY